jgi:hypothetical protein
MNATFLVLTAALAAVTLAFVLRPLMRRTPVVRPAVPPVPAPAMSADTPLAALEEIEFDRATGKLGDTDYAALKARYAKEAAASLAGHGVDVPVLPDGTVDIAELAIRQVQASARICPGCGPRGEDDAAFCSSCGRYLAEACPGCGALAPEPGSRYCASCGRELVSRS